MKLLQLRTVETHKRKQNWGIVPGLGGWAEVVYVFFGVIPLGGEKHTNKIPGNTVTIP